MSLHSYTRCWLHLVWGTLNRERMLVGEAAQRVSDFLYQYAKSKEISVKINHVNPDHVHVLIDLPTRYSIEEVAHLLKGGSSHWINQNNIIHGKFSWGRGYGAFSVSQSNLDDIIKYIADQEEHHRKKTFMEEYQELIGRVELEWKDVDENR